MALDLAVVTVGEVEGWLRGYGELGRVGVEGTGAYGAASARYLRADDVTVMEVNRGPTARSALRVVRRSAVKARTQAITQLKRCCSPGRPICAKNCAI